MQKPLLVARQEFTQSVVDTVNTSGLPAFVMRQILEEVIEQLKALEVKQEQAAYDAWQESLEQEKADNPDTEEVVSGNDT